MPLKDPDARRAYHREYMRQWYQKNREIHIERTTRVGQRHREAVRQYVNEVKRCPCADCGGHFPPFLMDFDHVRGTKNGILSRLSSVGMGWARVLEEIAKCEVVCSNCHRLRTHLRNQGVTVRPNEIMARLGPDYVSVLVY
jgi:hypothetical protein